MSKKEAWRRIHNFPDYEVNARGHVRRAGSKQKVMLQQGLIDQKVKLWHQGDPKTVNTSDLVKQYFPELQEGGSPVEWRQVESFPDYEVTVFGSIRNRHTKYELPVLAMAGFEAKVALWKDGIRHTPGVVMLIDGAFPSEVAVEA